ncbi:MAG: BstYI [Anaerolineae bacterium CG2_30_64_16]|nr:MAG: BstYI [Anaerolineae bacterium CG2_30_64_16]
MRIIYDYSHLGGSEILQVRYPECNRDIYEVITQIVAERTKVSREKTKRGQRLYAPSDMNRQFREEFTRRGYRELRDTYTITLPDSEIAIPGAFKQIDFVKDKVLIEIQFGKYFAMFYDMAKFQYFFNESKADVGVEIVPCHALHKQMSTGVAFGEQLVYDIERLKRHFPAVPVKVILIDADSEDATVTEQT